MTINCQCTCPPKVDETGKTLTVTDDGLVKLDHVTACRRVMRGGIIYIQFRDRDKMRSALRKTEFVEIPLTVLCDVLSMGTGWQEEGVDA